MLLQIRLTREQTIFIMSTVAGPVHDGDNPSWKFFAAFAAIAINNLAAALDATTLSVALPVSPDIKYHFHVDVR